MLNRLRKKFRLKLTVVTGATVTPLPDTYDTSKELKTRIGLSFLDGLKKLAPLDARKKPPFPAISHVGSILRPAIQSKK
jgi:hypothetical protein